MESKCDRLSREYAMDLRNMLLRVDDSMTTLREKFVTTASPTALNLKRLFDRVGVLSFVIEDNLCLITTEFQIITVVQCECDVPAAVSRGRCCVVGVDDECYDVAMRLIGHYNLVCVS